MRDGIIEKKRIRRLFRGMISFVAVSVLLCSFAGCDSSPAYKVPPVVTALPTAVGTTDPNKTDTPSPTNNVVISTSAPVQPGNTEAPVVDTEIVFSDPYFEAVIREALGKNIGSIYASDVSRITSLTARVRGIRNVDDLKYFVSLESLDLYGNKICDLSPLASLTGLKRLNVSGNYSALNDKTGGSAMSLKPLSNLILLQHLEVEGNGVTDISPLSSLVNMEYLNIRSNAITELGGLSQMKMLRELQAGKNKIVDASALGNCTMLEIIGLESNSFYVQDDLGEYSFVGLGDISFAETLVELKNINVSSNLVSSLAPLANAENIVSINAMSNHIADIECLRGSLVSQLFLESNFITTFAAIESMPNLTELGFYGNPIEDAHAVEVFVFKQNYPGATLPPELTENREIAGDI